VVRAGLEEEAMLASGLLDEGAVQFILFGAMVVVMFIGLWLTVDK
jgi:hypothetical protein